MSKEKTVKTVKTMTDPAGNEVPAIYVKKYDKLRDKLVARIEGRWSKARALLEALMLDTLSDLADLQAARQDETGVELAEKGNFRVTSFDGNTAVELRQSYRIYLDDRVQDAQRIMIAWAAGLADQIADAKPRALMMQLIEEAFQANASGALPAGKILSLLKRDIPPEAKRLLEAAIQPERGKRYVNVLKRTDRQHDYQRIALDISDCWPEVGEEV